MIVSVLFIIGWSWFLNSLILLSLATREYTDPIYSLSYDPGPLTAPLPSLLVIAVIPISPLTEKLKIFISESVRALFLNYPKILSLSITLVDRNTRMVFGPLYFCFFSIQ
uniref:Uncharacterized protein n=1 Tax=Cacopsylla melanoneura TaxID=428564 RepID=A0A8D9F8D5_9HEMI